MTDATEAAIARVDAIGDAPSRDRRPTFPLVRASSMRLEPVDPLVEDLIERGSLACLFGAPASCKSFVALDLAACVATGSSWHGREVRHGPVVYVAGEGHRGIARRVKAWERHHGRELADAPLYVSEVAAAFTDFSSAAQVEAAVANVQEGEGPPQLIVVDTVARNFGAADENATRDMGAFVQNLDHLRARFDCTLLLVHHTGHGDQTRARGAVALRAALDSEFRLDKDATGLVRMVCTKSKESGHPPDQCFRLRTVALAEIAGESAVLEPAEDVPQEQRGRATGKWQSAALEHLRALHGEHRSRVEASGRDPDEARVLIHDWRDRCIDEGMPRQRFPDVRDALLEKVLIHLEPPHVRPV